MSPCAGGLATRQWPSARSHQRHATALRSENGADRLRQVFGDVTVRWRDDPLVFQSVAQALEVYRGGLFARGAPERMANGNLERLAAALAPHMRDALTAAADAHGQIAIPRRSGCFTARA